VVRRKNKDYVPEKFTYFWRKESPFSQHFKCKITIDGKDYLCTEQWMMKQKALCFGKIGLANRIMQMEEPGAKKRAGRQIRNFDQEIWDSVAGYIVHKGNLQKLLQNITLLKALKLTKGTTPVEASPFDWIWGIGCYATEPAAQRRKTWRGLNLLGKILTDIREELISDEQVESVIETDEASEHIKTVGMSLEPVADFEELKRKCPETNILIGYLEKGILRMDQKLKWK